MDKLEQLEGEDNKTIHIRSFLTDQILIEEHTPEGRIVSNYNHAGLWSLVYIAHFTEDTVDKVGDLECVSPAAFRGHMQVRTSPFFLREYDAYSATINKRAIEQMKLLITDNKVGDISQPIPTFVVDVEPLLNRRVAQ